VRSTARAARCECDSRGTRRDVAFAEIRWAAFAPAFAHARLPRPEQTSTFYPTPLHPGHHAPAVAAPRPPPRSASGSARRPLHLEFPPRLGVFPPYIGIRASRGERRHDDSSPSAPRDPYQAVDAHGHRSLRKDKLTPSASVTAKLVLPRRRARLGPPTEKQISNKRTRTRVSGEENRDIRAVPTRPASVQTDARGLAVDRGCGAQRASSRRWRRPEGCSPDAAPGHRIADRACGFVYTRRGG